MTYQLGVDLGTTFTAAAVYRDGRSEVASLGNRSASVPSVVYLKEDETVLTGEAAERRALTESGRVAREFKRRLGDPTPILLGSTPYSAEALLSKLLRWTIDAVSEREGAAPDHIAVTHPANWGAYKKDLFSQTVRLADLDEAATITEPEAAAIYYASNERIEPGSVVAVYDLGGGTFDATVLRKTERGFDILGSPEGIERLGGIDFDEAVFSHVDRTLDGAVSGLDPNEQSTVAALVRLRQDCVSAKEALSQDTDTTVPVMLPGIQTEVRLTRAEFEAMIRPTLTQTIGALSRALRSAEVARDEVTAVLLVGGSSRIPLAAELVSGEVGRPVAVDAHPKYAVAMGAAIAAANGARADATEPVHVSSVPATPAKAASVSTGAAEQESVVEQAKVEPAPRSSGTPHATTAGISERTPEAAPGGPPVERTPPPPPEARKSPSSRVMLGVAAAAVAVVAGIGYFLFAGDEGAEAPESAPTEQTVAAPADAEPTPALPTPPTGADFFSRISEITLEGGRYAVAFDTFGFEPRLGSGNKHLHFFFDTVPPSQAGVPGGGPWRIHPDRPGVVGSSPFTGYSASDRPSGATQMCVLVANADHSVIAGTGTCLDLPS